MRGTFFVYICGPMAGYDEHNFPAFRECAAHLARTMPNWTVINPVDLELNATTEPGSLPRATYLREDVRELLECDAIVRLPGWHNSRGASLENHVARELSLDVWDYALINGKWQLFAAPTAPSILGEPEPGSH